MKYFILIALFIPLLIACGKEEKKEDLTYRFSVNGCDTGEQKSTSKDEFCGKLRNDQLNNFCAKDLREKEFAARSCG